MCYEIERFVDEQLAGMFLCSICENVLCCPQKDKNEPQSKQEQTEDNDGELYCEVCINKISSKCQNCSGCNIALTATKLQPLNKNMRNLLKGLKLRCKYDGNGCKHVDEYELIEQHEINCEFKNPDEPIQSTINKDKHKNDSKHSDDEIVEIIRASKNAIKEQKAIINNLIPKIKHRNAKRAQVPEKKKICWEIIIFFGLMMLLLILLVCGFLINIYIHMSSQITGTWNLVNDEDLREYFKAFNVDFKGRSDISSDQSSKLVISKGWRSWTLGYETSNKKCVISFVDGQEFDEETIGGKKSKSVIKTEWSNKLVYVRMDESTGDVERVTYEVKLDKLIQTYEAKNSSVMRIYSLVSKIAPP